MSASLQLLTEAEVAKLLGIGQRTLRGFRASGAIAYVKIGRAIKYTADDVASFIKRHRHEGAKATARASRARVSGARADGIKPFSEYLREKRAAERKPPP